MYPPLYLMSLTSVLVSTLTLCSHLLQAWPHSGMLVAVMYSFLSFWVVRRVRVRGPRGGGGCWYGPGYLWTLSSWNYLASVLIYVELR